MSFCWFCCAAAQISVRYGSVSESIEHAREIIKFLALFQHAEHVPELLRGLLVSRVMCLVPGRRGLVSAITAGSLPVGGLPHVARAWGSIAGTDLTES